MKACHVALVDFYADGHHAPYMLDLVKGLRGLGVKVTVIGPIEFQVEGLSQVIVLKGCKRLKRFNGMRRQWVAFPICRRAIAHAIAAHATHIHFLYSDWHVSAIALAWRLYRPAMNLVLTIHWLRGAGGGKVGVKNWIRRAPHRIALRWLARREGARLLVHHETLVKGISHIVGSKDIGVIPYPSRPLPKVGMYECVHLRQTLGVRFEDKLILCYGGTRFDKGADLAINALARLTNRFHLLCAGEPLYFQPEYLQRQAKLLGVECRLHLMPKFISDAETALIFHSCDIVLFPYRRIFSGQSGPLTQALAIGKAVATADLPVLQETVNKYDLGVIFPAENVSAMAEAVQAAVDWNPNPKNVSAFVADHSPLTFSRAVCENYDLEAVCKREDSCRSRDVIL